MLNFGGVITGKVNKNKYLYRDVYHECIYIYTYKQHIDTRPALPGKELRFSLFQPAVKNHFKKKPRARQKVAWHRDIFQTQIMVYLPYQLVQDFFH